MRQPHSEVALRLAEAGVSVFPCQPTGDTRKQPMPGVFWRNQSTTDPDRVAAWWRRWPDAVVGIDLAKSGLLVIDCDRKDGRADGVAAFLRIAPDGALDTVPQVETPSTGVHFYFRQTFDPPHGNARGALPAGIDVRGHGGYVIAPGCEIDTGAYAQVVDGDIPDPPPWLIGYLRPLVPKARPAHVVLEPSDSRSNYAEEALRRECDAVASAGPGTRNETANVAGFNLGQLVPHLLGENEVVAALEQAAANWGVSPRDKAFGPKGTIARAVRAGMQHPRTPEQHARELVDVEGLLVDAETGEILEEPPIPSGDLPAGILNVPGLLGDIVQWIVASSEKPQPALALGAALTVLGTAMGRHVSGPTRSGTHLYVVGLAKTGYGKDDAKNAIPTLLRAAGMVPHLGPDEFISMPSVINFLLRAPLSVCAMDEFGAFLKRINNRRASGFEASISKALRTAWGSSFKTMMTPEWAGRAAQPIVAPCMSIYGVSNPDEFWGALSGSDASNGFLNRFLVVEAKTKPPARTRVADPSIVPDGIRDGLKDIYARQGDMVTAFLNRSDEAPKCDVIPWASPDVSAARVEFANAVEEESEKHPERAAFLARTAEMAVRLATIRAVSMDPAYPAVSMDDLDWGIALARHSADAMMNGVLENIAENDDQQNYKLVRGIVTKGQKMARTELYNALGGRIRKRVLDEIIDGLVEAGEIEVAKVKKEGSDRPVTVYIAKRRS